jgi:hypothetical protein
MLDAEVYPISFIWRSDAWTTVTNILKDAFATKRPEGFLDGTKDFMLDRLDDALEPVARTLTGKLQWDEMKENALLATTSKSGGARITLNYIKALADKLKDKFEIHVAGHSAGSIFHAPLVQLLTSKGKITAGSLKGNTGYGLPVSTCTLWAPACTVDLLKTSYLPAINANAIRKFSLFCIKRTKPRITITAVKYIISPYYTLYPTLLKQDTVYHFSDLMVKAILGMQKFVNKDKDLSDLFKGGKADLVLSPNAAPEGIRQSCY